MEDFLEESYDKGDPPNSTNRFYSMKEDSNIVERLLMWMWMWMSDFQSWFLFLSSAEPLRPQASLMPDTLLLTIMRITLRTFNPSSRLTLLVDRTFVRTQMMFLAIWQ